jgi:methionine sulfoxide reductase heme-binding subunit
LAWLSLLPLALTSTRGAPTRMGYARWKRLHRLVYPAAILAVIHFYLRVKADHTLPLWYAALLLFSFAVRGIAAFQKARAAQRRAARLHGT